MSCHDFVREEDSGVVDLWNFLLTKAGHKLEGLEPSFFEILLQSSGNIGPTNHGYHLLSGATPTNDDGKCEISCQSNTIGTALLAPVVPGFQDLVAGDIEAGEVDLEHHPLEIPVSSKPGSGRDGPRTGRLVGP